MARIAVYGTLRRGFDNYQYYLTDQVFCGQETIKLPMKMISLGGFPGLVRDDKVNDIVIEVFEVDEETFRGVDGLEGYPNFYNRMEVDTSKGKAWIYHLSRYAHDNKKVITSGDWKEYRTTKIHSNEVFSQD